jgi:AcrR family transcriptional regulator
MELFGQRGYHGTSHRALAQTAGVNQALIGYHFGGKRGLYLAAFEQLAHEMGSRLRPTAEKVAELLQGEAADRDDLLAGVLTLTDRFVEVMASPETASWSRLIIREQQEPGDAFDILYQRLMARILGVLSGLLAGIVGRAADSPEVRLLALTIVGQALFFRTARASVLRAMGWEAMGPAEIALIQKRIRSNVTAMLRQAR